MRYEYINEPTVELRTEQPYVAIPIQVTLKDWAQTTVLLPEIYDWLNKKDIEPSGEPFYRYWCIGSEDAEFSLEVGVPIERMVTGDERVIASFIPGGSYAIAVHQGPPDQLGISLKQLEEWTKKEELDIDKRWEADDEIWNGRFEYYLTDPELEPDLHKWQIEIAFLLMQDDAA
ncbi:GyrI-like domain-containing protein [Planococcus sp. N064]|uniref:GyrI-like domain-containing protein n=1 Tax=Planococcus liqunii TaxID=3058394 RepID=A0ABT8MND6_9BACL|nr:GyrI-like domain-containing protein [Planococcus sp. N064]MDN7226301.1 GyrI-like domain-containing protein [Planococcus sp. N064]